MSVLANEIANEIANDKEVLDLFNYLYDRFTYDLTSPAAIAEHGSAVRNGVTRVCR